MSLLGVGIPAVDPGLLPGVMVHCKKAQKTGGGVGWPAAHSYTGTVVRGCWLTRKLVVGALMLTGGLC